MGTAKNLMGQFVKRMPILPGYGDDNPSIVGRPPDKTSRQVVEYREPEPPVPGAPGSVHIHGRGWWPADRVLVSAQRDVQDMQPDAHDTHGE